MESEREKAQLESSVLVEEIAKSKLLAKSMYDYQYLNLSNVYLMDCDIEEKKESLVFSYKTNGMKPLETLQKGTKLKKLEVLIRIAKLRELAEKYSFTLHPNNIYCDTYGQIKVLKRDIRKAICGDIDESFLISYRALIGSLLSAKYTYEDIWEGGQSLLGETQELSDIMKAENLEDIQRILDRLYKATLEREQKTTIKVKRNQYKSLVTYAVISIVLVLGLAGVSVYAYIVRMPKQTAIMKADNAYIEGDYVGVIDELKVFEIDELDDHQRYILALSYIQSQSIDTFRGTQKEMVLSKVDYNGDKNIMNYWIYLGRLDADSAINIAMQLSDDQLLLYGYMQELSLVEKNQNLTGEEKRQRSEELMKQITALADKLGIDYEEEVIEETVEDTEESKKVE